MFYERSRSIIISPREKRYLLQSLAWELSKIKGVVVAILDVGSVYNGHLDFNVCIDNHTLNRLDNYTGLFIAYFIYKKVQLNF